MSDFREELLLQKEVKLKLYYYREDNNYAGWSVLVWGGGSEQKKIDFFEDLKDGSYGRVAEVVLRNRKDTERVYFAIGKIDKNNNFLERECEEDRFVLTKDADQNGNIEVCVIHGKKELQRKVKDVVCNIHYKRWKRDYKDWDVHTWMNGKKSDIKFVDDEYPCWKVAKYRLSNVKPSDRLGLMIRKGGNRWLEKGCKEKVVNLRKYERNGVADIYMIQGVKKEVFNNMPIIMNGHYWRYDGDYKDWNLWVWMKYKDGITVVNPGFSVDFNRDDNTFGKMHGIGSGKIATFVLDSLEDIEYVGFLVKKGDWEERDIDLDRRISVSTIEKICRERNSNMVDFYFTQGELKFGFKEEDIALDEKIVDATFREISREETKIRTVDVELNVKYKEYKNNGEKDRAFVAPFILKSEDGEIIPISSVQHRGEKKGDKNEGRFFRINLETEDNSYKLKPFDKRYTLELKGYTSSVVSRRKLYDRPEYEDMLTYDGDDLGVTYSEEKSKFRVWAPEAERIELVLYDEDTGSDPIDEIDLKKSIGGTWYREVPVNLKGMFYTYRVYSGTQVVEIVDPYAKSSGINVERGAIIDLADTNPEGWDDVPRPEFNNETDAMITEIHVRNYSIKESSGVRRDKRGKFVALTEENTRTLGGEKTCLSHIEDMGYTHVQIMPITKCGSLDETQVLNKGNWGYDTAHVMITEGTYSTNPHDPIARIKEFKKVVQEFHKKGIRVILDVVFNHTYKTQFSNLNVLMEKYYHRVRGEIFSDATGCSNEIASERKMVRKYIVDTVKYWAKEFKIDGFRFDVMYLLDKKTLNEVRKEVDKIDPSILVYGEGWDPTTDTTIDSRLLAKRTNAHDMPRVAFFSNEAADAIKGKFDKPVRGFALNGDQDDDIWNKMYRLKRGIVADVRHPQLNNIYDKVKPNQVVNFVGVHDNLTWWDKIKISVNNSEKVKRKMYRLGYSILCTMQGALVIPEGDEFLRTKNCNNNSYDANDEINGIDWDRKEEYIEDNNYIKGLLTMRKAHKGFRMDNPDEIREKVRFLDNMPDKVIGYTINDHANGDISDKIAIIHNGGWREETIQLPEKGWSVIVNDKVAGATEIGRIKGDRVRVLAHSSMVLTNEKR